MSQAAPAIPEKLFFKIGEVCDIAGVQAHVLRYWESEFPTLAPQKNRAGQRTYRRRDVEMALRIKELLYDEQYTIAGAKKKLASEIRGGSAREPSTSMTAKAPGRSLSPPPSLAGRIATASPASPTAPAGDDQRAALRQIAKELREILDLLDEGEIEAVPTRAKKR
ncbi:MAG TPA: MerR family transcriptional regulator [Pyrinomonadaceae bacterium]|nr:MerR family transcriptional regulator [Pyrinomonadaceae bacterium]